MKQLITILLCLFTLFAEAQVNPNDTTKYFKSYDYGFSYKRLQARDAFIMPTDTVINKLGVVSLNGFIYLGNGIKWTSIGSATSIDTTSLSNRINKKIDSLKRNSDSVYAFINGVKKFQYKDSIGTTIDTTNQFVKRLDRIPGKDSIIYFVGANRFAIKDSVGSNGSVTSVAALSLGTSGSDLSSTVANGTTTPVITLNVPDASTSARGVVTSASQTFGGTKTFRDNIYVQKTSSTSQNITIGFGGGVADYDNLAFGSLALNSSTANAYANLGVGHYSLQKITNGNNNIGLGNYTLYSLINGQDNTAIGYSTLGKSTGYSNTVLGSNAAIELVTGNNNTLIGASVFNTTTSGSNNTIIGKITGLGSSLSNNVIISDGSGNIRFKDDNTNTTLPRLAGTGTRMVTAGANGELATQTIPSGGSIAVDTIFRTTGKDSIFYKKNSITYAIKDSVGTNPAPVGYYGSFYDTTLQSATVINTAYGVKLGVTDLTNGVTITNNSKINFANAGIYNIQFSLQLEKTGGSGNMIADIWLRKNNVNLVGTNGKVVLTGSANASPVVAAWNYVVSISSNDSLELMWATDNLNVKIITASASSPHPSTASAILTVTQQSGIMAGTGISPLDTANMLSPYLRKIDTITLSNRINLKLNTADTSTLSNRINLKLNASDTASLSNRINLKLNIADTSTMLSKYLRKIDTITLSNRINLKLNISDTSTLQPKSISAYTILANNTTSTANAQAIFFKDTSGTYTGTPAWGTSAPTGATTHSYRWTRIGNMVTLTISLVYATASAASNTTLVIPLPSDAPTPAKPSGLNSASAFLYPAYCNGGNTLTNAQITSYRGGIRNNSGNNGFEISLTFSALIAIYFQTTITYFTN